MNSETLTYILLRNEVTNPYYGGVMACDSLPSFDINWWVIIVLINLATASTSDKYGQFCLFFGYARCNKETFKGILAYFETENISQNDLIVQNFYNGFVKHKNPFMYYEEKYI